MFCVDFGRQTIFSRILKNKNTIVTTAIDCMYKELKLIYLFTAGIKHNIYFKRINFFIHLIRKMKLKTIIIRLNLGNKNTKTEEYVLNIFLST